MDWLNERFAIAAKIARSKWFQLLLILWGVVTFYDTVVSQFVPESFSKRFPKMHELITETSGWLPLWGWLLVLAAIVVGASFEYAVRTSPERRRSQPNSAAAGPRIELFAPDVLIAQEGLFPAKYIQAGVRGIGNVLGCQVSLNKVERRDGNASRVVYEQPLLARWSGLPDVAVDINDGQETRANLFSVSRIIRLEKYFLLPQTRHSDEALRQSVSAPGLYWLTVVASSKTTAAV